MLPFGTLINMSDESNRGHLQRKFSRDITFLMTELAGYTEWRKERLDQGVTESLLAIVDSQSISMPPERREIVDLSGFDEMLMHVEWCLDTGDYRAIGLAGPPSGYLPSDQDIDNNDQQ